MAQIGLSSAPYSDGFLGLILWFFIQMIRQEMLLGGIMLLGVAYAVWRHDKYDIICLSYIFIFFVVFRDWGFRYLHLFTSAFGITAFLAGRFISDLLDKAGEGKSKVAVYALLIMAFSLSAWRGVDAGIRKMEDDTRILAKNWVEQNIPAGSKIGIDWYEFGPPLFDDIPVVVHSPAAQKVYRNNTTEKIKDDYRKFLSHTETFKKYHIFNLMYVALEPVWPAEMPAEAKERAEKIAAFVDLYSWFNFMSPDEISQNEVEYAILSSYAYSHFLLDNDKRKTGLFNPYIFEDMITCSRQAESYDGKSLNGLLFFLTKRARDFYLNFLDGRGSAVLIKEFVPEGRGLGPVIKIYKLVR